MSLKPDFEKDLVSFIPQMRAFARTLCRDPTQADDMAQEALVKALNHRDQYEMGTNMKAWLFMIVRNDFYSERSHSWRSTFLDQQVAERTLLAADNANDALALDDVRRALTMLPDDQRDALIMAGAGGLEYHEISELLGIAIGTVKSRISRARAALQRVLEQGDLKRDGGSAQDAMSTILASVPRTTPKR